MTDWDVALTSIAEDFRSAMHEATSARERPYYDQAADQAAAESYYAEATPDRLAELVTATHSEQPRYKPSLELYPWVDLQENGTLRSLYTAQVFQPEELIQADFAVLQARMARLTEMTMLGPSDPATMQAEVEAELPFNCEHVVPQSWFSEHEPMRGDLHHLFACESRCNSFRGNTPFAEFADFPQGAPPAPSDAPEATDAIRADCGKSASFGFEPAHGKGAAARAAFYFQLRYPDLVSVEEMPEDRWQVLLTWHHADPVSLWERHRNAAIFARQGNRNPYIDHPEWATRDNAQPR